MIPRLRTRGEGVMVDESMVRDTGPALLSMDLVPMRRSSVLLLLSLRKLCAIHDFIVEMQVSICVRGRLEKDLVRM